MRYKPFKNSDLEIDMSLIGMKHAIRGRVMPVRQNQNNGDSSDNGRN